MAPRRSGMSKVCLKPLRGKGKTAKWPFGRKCYEYLSKNSLIGFWALPFFSENVQKETMIDLLESFH